jgi:ABC-type proline/glycine betaine transport system permease subunit
VLQVLIALLLATTLTHLLVEYMPVLVAAVVAVPAGLRTMAEAVVAAQVDKAQRRLVQL